MYNILSGGSDKEVMTIYVWHTGHQINETLSMALHAGIPQSILKHTEWADNYFSSTNKHVAVGYGILRGTGDIFHHNQKHNIDYYEVDRGYINPNHFDGYYRISKNGLQAKYKADVDYPEDRLSKLKFERAEWFDPKGRIIICPPSEYIEQYLGLAPGWWENEIVQSLDGKTFKVRNKSDATPLDNDLQGAKCVITFNSNVAVDAAIKGVPIVTGMYSVAGRWSQNSMANVMNDTLKVQDPYDLLKFISYNQFTLEEIKSGMAWQIIST